MVEDGTMMGEKIFLFHIRGQEGLPEFLHPLEGTLEWIEGLKKHPLVGRYGAEPRIESIHLFREELQGILQKAIRRWAANRWFPHRFVLAAIAFLLAYFFLSYVIRDPLPLIDELLLSFLAGILAFRGLSRGFHAREEVTILREELQEKIDRIRFEESPLVRNIEALLEELEASSFKSLVDRYRRGEKLALHPEDFEEARGLLVALEYRLTAKERKKFLKELERGTYVMERSGAPRKMAYLFLYHLLVRSLS